MPLTDLVRHLNARSQAAGRGAPLLAEEGRVFALFAGWRLESHFLPIVETATGNLHGHAAALRVRLPPFDAGGGPALDPDGLFVLARDDADLIYLDRLIRTLHALNYLLRPVRGNLLLKVHPRHVLAVPDNHGLAFEEILRPCGLVPEQITLELDFRGVAATERLEAAVASYRTRGYGIAVNSRLLSPDPGRVARLGPDIVRLDVSTGAGRDVHGDDVVPLRAIDARILMNGSAIRLLDGRAAASDIDLLQSDLPGNGRDWPGRQPLAA